MCQNTLPSWSTHQHMHSCIIGLWKQLKIFVHACMKNYKDQYTLIKQSLFNRAVSWSVAIYFNRSVFLWRLWVIHTGQHASESNCISGYITCSKSTSYCISYLHSCSVPYSISCSCSVRPINSHRFLLSHLKFSRYMCMQY